MMDDLPIDSSAGDYGALFVLGGLILVSVWLGAQAQKIVERGSFLKGYFLGNRGLGAWALALTATVQSGGTFMGFPALVYSHGWIVSLWIGSYMVVPLTGFAVLGKRFAHLSRRTGAITVPDLFHERFDSPTLGLLSSLFIMFFMSITMIAQFKAGAIVMKLAWPGTGALALSEDVGASDMDWAYLIGLAIFAITVVSYTLIGGFLASVWTDMFQSVLMVVGVALLFMLIVPNASRDGFAEVTQRAVAATGPAFASGPGYSAKGGDAFLPLGLAVSFFFVWTFGGIGSPPGMVRVMACKDTATMRRSIVLLSFYNLLIYIPLIVICICARTILPNLDHPDEVIPRLALLSTKGWTGGSLVSGLILTAPFGAIMASVSAFLVLISSGLVRDVYQRVLRPRASDNEIRWASHGVMAALGVMAVVANIWPVKYLQALVVLSSTTTAASFVTPAMMAAYWRRATAAGAISSMCVGGATVVGLYLWLGFGINTNLWGLHPVIYGLSTSLITGVVVSLLTAAPPPHRISQLFDAEPVAGK